MPSCYPNVNSRFLHVKLWYGHSCHIQIFCPSMAHIIYKLMTASGCVSSLHGWTSGQSQNI